MRRVIWFLFLLSKTVLYAQSGLFVNSEGSLTSKGIVTITNGDFVSSTTVQLGGTLQIKGLDGKLHRVELGSINSMDYLELYGNSQIELEGNLTLNRELLFNDNSSLALVANSYIILAEEAEIVGESTSNTITGADGTYITTTDFHLAGTTQDFGHIGIEVSNGETSMGETQVYRRYGTFEIEDNLTINRYYEINPTTNSDLGLDVLFFIGDVDLNGLDREELAAFRSEDGGATFTNEGGTSYSAFHLVEDVEAFSIWTFAHADLLSTEDNLLSSSITLYPNPVAGQLQLGIPLGVGTNSYTIYTTLGKMVQTGKIDAGEETVYISVENLSSGVYFINLQREDAKQKTLRFIKI